MFEFDENNLWESEAGRHLLTSVQLNEDQRAWLLTAPKDLDLMTDWVSLAVRFNLTLLQKIAVSWLTSRLGIELLLRLYQLTEEHVAVINAKEPSKNTWFSVCLYFGFVADDLNMYSQQFWQQKIKFLLTEFHDQEKTLYETNDALQVLYSHYGDVVWQTVHNGLMELMGLPAANLTRWQKIVIQGNLPLIRPLDLMAELLRLNLSVAEPQAQTVAGLLFSMFSADSLWTLNWILQAKVRGSLGEVLFTPNIADLALNLFEQQYKTLSSFFSVQTLVYNPVIIQQTVLPALQAMVRFLSLGMAEETVNRPLTLTEEAEEYANFRDLALVHLPREYVPVAETFLFDTYEESFINQPSYLQTQSRKARFCLVPIGNGLALAPGQAQKKGKHQAQQEFAVRLRQLVSSGQSINTPIIYAGVAAVSDRHFVTYFIANTLSGPTVLIIDPCGQDHPWDITQSLDQRQECSDLLRAFRYVFPNANVSLLSIAMTIRQRHSGFHALALLEEAVKNNDEQGSTVTLVSDRLVVDSIHLQSRVDSLAKIVMQQDGRTRYYYPAQVDEASHQVRKLWHNRFLQKPANCFYAIQEDDFSVNNTHDGHTLKISEDYRSVVLQQMQETSYAIRQSYVLTLPECQSYFREAGLLAKHLLTANYETLWALVERIGESKFQLQALAQRFLKYADTPEDYLRFALVAIFQNALKQNFKAFIEEQISEEHSDLSELLGSTPDEIFAHYLGKAGYTEIAEYFPLQLYFSLRDSVMPAVIFHFCWKLNLERYLMPEIINIIFAVQNRLSDDIQILVNLLADQKIDDLPKILQLALIYSAGSKKDVEQQYKQVINKYLNEKLTEFAGFFVGRFNQDSHYYPSISSTRSEWWKQNLDTTSSLLKLVPLLTEAHFQQIQCEYVYQITAELREQILSVIKSEQATASPWLLDLFRAECSGRDLDYESTFTRILQGLLEKQRELFNAYLDCYPEHQRTVWHKAIMERYATWMREELPWNYSNFLISVCAASRRMTSEIATAIMKQEFYFITNFLHTVHRIEQVADAFLPVLCDVLQIEASTDLAHKLARVKQLAFMVGNLRQVVEWYGNFKEGALKVLPLAGHQKFWDECNSIFSLISTAQKRLSCIALKDLTDEFIQREQHDIQCFVNSLLKLFVPHHKDGDISVNSISPHFRLLLVRLHQKHLDESLVILLDSSQAYQIDQELLKKTWVFPTTSKMHNEIKWFIPGIGDLNSPAQTQARQFNRDSLIDVFLLWVASLSALKLQSGWEGPAVSRYIQLILAWEHSDVDDVQPHSDFIQHSAAQLAQPMSRSSTLFFQVASLPDFAIQDKPPHMVLIKRILTCYQRFETNSLYAQDSLFHHYWSFMNNSRYQGLLGRTRALPAEIEIIQQWQVQLNTLHARPNGIYPLNTLELMSLRVLLHERKTNSQGVSTQVLYFAERPAPEDSLYILLGLILSDAFKENVLQQLFASKEQLSEPRLWDLDYAPDKKIHELPQLLNPESALGDDWIGDTLIM